MSPEIALCLCMGLIAVLFVADSRQKEGLSLGIWLPTIWMMYCGSRPLATWFDPGSRSIAPVDYREGSAIDRVFLSVLIVLGLALLSRRRLRWSKIINDNPWIFVFFVYMAFSVGWSDYPGVSFKRWMRTTGDLVMALLVVSESNSLVAVKTIFRRSAFVLLPLSVVLIKYFPAIGREYTQDGLATMWTGVTTQKNDLGYVAMVCGLYFVNNLAARWKNGGKQVLVDVLFLVLSLWLLVGSSTSSSKTSWATFALGACLLVVFHVLVKNPQRTIAKYGLVIVLMLFFVAVTTLYGPPGDLPVTALDRDSTLTGRTDIWKAVLEIGPRNQLLGRGYGSFWIGNLSNDIWSKFYTPIQQSHNGYVDIYIELGTLGLALLVCLIWSAYNDIKRKFASNLEYGTFRIVFLSVILLHNLTESSFGRPTQLMWFLFLLVCLNISSVSRVGERTA
jgi:exopolysaccharide production protein ExoQ